MKLNLITTLSGSATILGALLLAPPVFAHGHGGPGHMFSKVDTNGDGKITRTEAHTKVFEHFANIDKNGDKVLTRHEMKAHHEEKMKERGSVEERVEERFKEQDKNNNGKIERSESKLPGHLFQRIDLNGDGAITVQEALDAHKARQESPEEHDNKKAGKNRGRNGHSPFDRIDANGDGKITQTEAKKAADGFFSRLDANKDNVVTQDEAKSARRGPPHHRRGEDRAKKDK